MDWQEERAKFWEEFDLWDDKHEPAKRESYTVYIVELPLKVKQSWARAMYNPFTLWVGVDKNDCLHVENHSWWFGKKFGEMSYGDQREVIDYLVEWELAEWKQIGPDDHEIFATDKLTAKEEERQW